MTDSAFPPLNVMLAIDVVVLSIAIIASAVVYRWRADITRCDAALGIGCILAGLWLITGVYLADLYAVTFLHETAGAHTATSTMLALHLEVCWYAFSIAAVLVFSGLVLTVLRLSSQLRDMAARTEELLENENILDSIFENLPVGLLIKDSNHVIERSNKAYLSWYGDALEDMVGQRFDHIKGFQSEEDARIMNEQEDEVLRTGKLIQRQVDRPFVDGKFHTLSITKFPVYDRDGNITKVGSVSVDLTELVKAEEAMRNALAEAEQATRAKSQFIATMSHEFRTPLNAILGFSEMLRGEFFGPLGARNYTEYANDIHESGEHLLRLVNDILDMAAIEAGKRTLAKDDIDIADVLRECMRSVEQAARERGIDLFLDVPDGIPPLQADRRALAQIFINILANATKFTEAGGTISIGARADDKSLTVRVSDTGVGISDELLSRITEPFAKGQSNPHVAESGSGLGLSIVKSLVDAHGGELLISSKTGVGTAVYITLPY